jgi:hypothetical protein
MSLVDYDDYGDDGWLRPNRLQMVKYASKFRIGYKWKV